jgi:hypothetical protein
MLMRDARLKFLPYRPWLGCALIADIALGEFQRSQGSQATSLAEGAPRFTQPPWLASRYPRCTGLTVSQVTSFSSPEKLLQSGARGFH